MKIASIQLDSELIKNVLDQAECIYTANEVEAALDRMAININAELTDKNPILICVMNGGLVVMGKLLTRLNFQLQIDFIHATRYRNATTGSDLEWRAEPSTDIKDREVVIIDDILDEGVTLKSIVDYCRSHQCRSVYTAVLVEKIHQRKVGLDKADFVGLQVEDKYVFGYGMDYKGFLRNAPGIYAVKKN